MIIGSMIENIRDQNWFTVTVEVLVVVVGIYLGLQAQQWGEERADRAEEQEYLTDLETDILASIELAKEHQLNNVNVLKSLEYVLKFETGSGLAEQKDHFENAVYFGLYTYGIIYVQNSTYMEMVSSGKLTLIQNKELRKSLSYLENRIILRLRNSEKNILTLMTSQIDPMVVNNYPVGQFIRFDEDRESYITDIDLFKSVNKEISTDFLNIQKNRNIIIYRIAMQTANHRWTNQILTQYEKILELIRDELAA